jgi:hypothetical protein
MQACSTWPTALGLGDVRTVEVQNLNAGGFLLCSWQRVYVLIHSYRHSSFVDDTAELRVPLSVVSARLTTCPTQPFRPFSLHSREGRMHPCGVDPLLKGSERLGCLRYGDLPSFVAESG